MAINFNAQFTVNEKTATRVLKLTDTSTGFTLAKGNFSVTFPDGSQVIHTDFTSPDISAPGGFVNIALITDIDNTVLTGTYIVNFVAINAALTEFTLQRTFDFNWEKPTKAITNESDVVLPDIKFLDSTTYETSGSFSGVLTRNFFTTTPSTSEVGVITKTSAGDVLMPSNASKYYEGIYLVRSDISVAYTHTSLSWLTVLYVDLLQETYDIREAPTQDELVALMNTYKDQIEAYKTTNPDEYARRNEEYDLVVGLYSHLIARFQTSTLDGCKPILDQLLGLLPPTEPYTYKATQMLPFTINFTTSLTGSGTIGNIPKFTGVAALGDSIIKEDTGRIGIGKTPATTLDVNGAIQGTSIVKSGGTSSQFLKADGSVDASTYLTTGSASSTYQPLDADLTAIAVLAGAAGILTKVSANTWTLDTTSYQVLDADLTAIAALAGTSGILIKTAANTWSLDTTSYQVLDADLTAIAALAGTSGILIKTAANTWALDTSTYQLADADLTAIAALAGTSGLIRKTAANTYELDASVYLTGITSGQITTALGFTPENAANKGVNNGYAGLDGTGKVPSTQLPSYVDDVIEAANVAALPATGETGKIYVTLDTNKIYRWTGSVYVEVSPTVGTIWGGITGTLSNQTDLQSALDAKQATLTLTTTGTSGAATLAGATLNIPIYQGGVTSFNTRTGAITLISSDVTTALTFTPYNATNPSSYIALTALSSTATGLTYTNTTGVFSLTGGYAIPTTIKQGNWDDAYTWVAAFPTQTGNSGKYLTTDGSALSWASIVSGVSSFNTRTGAVTLTSTDVTTALTYTPYPTPAGTTAQYVDGTGALQTFPVLASADKLILVVRNTSGATITKGTVVYINGANGNKPTIAKALATGDATSAQTLGLVQDNIANNSNGNIVLVGSVIDLDTSSFTEGQQLYLSGVTAGTYTATKTLAPTHLVYVGVITRAHPTQGVIEVKIQNGYELDEIHDVSIVSKANNEGLFYESATSLWKNKTIATVLGYTPANDANVVKLTGDQTIAGLKSFSKSENGTLGAVGAMTLGIGTSNDTATKHSGFGFGLNTGTYYPAYIAYVNASSTGSTKGELRFAVRDVTTDTAPTVALTIQTSGAVNFGSSVTATSLIKSGGTSAQFLKADGSVDSTAYTTNTGTVTSVSALTIGTTGTDLSSTVATGTTTPVITLNVPTASAANRGALSAADWTTFNSKQSTITLTTTGSSGASTFTSNTLNVPTYTLSGLGGQPLATNLTSLAGLTFASTSFVKMTAAGTFALDTTVYGTGTVTSVAAITLGTTGTDLSSTVATGTTTPVITLNVPTASAANRGALSAADWTTFNNKASTAALANYLPLAGGTLTGALGGTTATFTHSSGETLTLSKGSGPSIQFNKSAATVQNWALAGEGAAFKLYDYTASTVPFQIATTTGAATFAGALSGTSATFSGQLHIPNNSTGTLGGLYFDYNANAASRTWQIVSDYDAYGDFQIRQSTTQTGSTYSKILGFSPTGAATFSSSVTTGGKITINKDLEALTVSGGTSTNATYMSFQANTQAGWMIIGSQGNSANYIQTGTGVNESAITTVGAYALALGTNQIERMRITSGGNVGIGTTTDAGYKLDVNGTGRFSGALSGTSASFSSTLTSVGATINGANNAIIDLYNTALADTNARNWRIVTNESSWGALEFRVSTANNNAPSSAKLILAKDGAATFTSTISATGATLTGALGGTSATFSNEIKATALSGGGALYLRGNSANNLAQVYFFDNTETTLYHYLSGNASELQIRAQGARALSFYTNSTERLNIASTGAATFSSNALSLQGASYPAITAKATATFPIFSLVNDAQTAQWNIELGRTTSGNLEFYNSGTKVFFTPAGAATFSSSITLSGDFNLNGGEFNSTGRILMDAGPGQGFLFRTDNVAVSAMTITAGGNVLIGTTTDAGYKLDVNGTGRFSGMLTVTNGSGVASVFTAGNGGYSALSWTGDNGATYGSLTTISSTVLIGSRNSGGTGSNGEIGIVPYAARILTLNSNGAGAATFSSSVTAPQFNAFNDRNYLARGSFRLTSASNNASTLDISVTDGTTSIYSNYFSGGTDNTIVIATYASISNQLVLKSSGNVLIGTTTDATGKLQVNGSIYATSFFESSSVAYKNILATNPVTSLNVDVIKYKRTNVDVDDVRYGYSAEQINSLMPELTNKEATAVKYLDVHTLLIAELQREIKELKARLN